MTFCASCVTNYHNCEDIMLERERDAVVEAAVAWYASRNTYKASYNAELRNLVFAIEHYLDQQTEAKLVARRKDIAARTTTPCCPDNKPN